MSWNERYASEKYAGIGDTLKALNPFKRKPEPQIAPSTPSTAQVYRHPITGNGICGAPGGCAECGRHLGAIQGIMGSEILPQGISAEDHSSAIGGAIESLSKANGHWMSNPHGHMGKSPTQHLAGMVDKLKGSLETVQALDPSELGDKTKQKLRGVVSSINPLKGYAGGLTADETNFEEDGPLPHL